MGELLVTEEVALLDGLSGRAAAEAEGATIAISFGPPLAVGLASILAADAVATATPAPVIALTNVKKKKVKFRPKCLTYDIK